MGGLRSVWRTIAAGDYRLRFWNAWNRLPIPTWSKKLISTLVVAVAVGVYFEALGRLLVYIGGKTTIYNGLFFFMGAGTTILLQIRNELLPLWRDWRAWRRKRRQRKNRKRIGF